MNGFPNHAAEIDHHMRMLRAFREGKAAGEAHDSHDTTGCPYRIGSMMADEWFLGYKEGRKCHST